jgi:uncharacterized protein (DUF1786 family)
VPTTDLLATLRALVDAEIRFVVVGGVAAILAGAILNTRDVDIVYDLGEDNLTKLAEMLKRIHAIYRDPAGRRIEPNIERLQTQRVNLLRTDLGDLDVLQEIGNGWRYETLVPWSTLEDVDNVRLYVLGLSRLIETGRRTAPLSSSSATLSKCGGAGVYRPELKAASRVP